ncbi:MAG: glycosyltransferase, partial [Ardenticatenaceae bacterium]
HHMMGLPAAIGELIRRKGIPYVITLHDYWWGCANAQLLTNDREELCEGPERWINCGRCALARAGLQQGAWAAPAIAPLFAYRERRLRPILEGAQRLIAPTTFTREMYRKMGLPVGKVDVIPHGIRLREAWSPSRVERPGSGCLRVAYVGGIARQKGVHVLVEAINRLSYEEVQLSIFGDLSLYPDYVAELRALSQHPGIRFEGSIANPDLLPRLATADVLVVPSIWYETAALVIQEAFAAGIPVIASDIGALRERVRHGGDGLLVPPGDADALHAALRRLLDKPSLLPRLRAGIGPVRTIDEQVDEIEELYRTVISQTQGATPRDRS